MTTAHRMPLMPNMVAARRKGIKTNTRRVITRVNSTVDGARWGKEEWAALDLARATVDPGLGGGPYLKAPLRDGDTVHRVRPIYGAGDLMLFGESLDCDPWGFAHYAHDKACVRVAEAAAQAKGWSVKDGALLWPWQPYSLASIYCPKELVRDKAVLVSCRPERIQEISAEDAAAEGVDLVGMYGYDQIRETFFEAKQFMGYPPRRKFRLLWDMINGPRGHGWVANGFVWRLEIGRFLDNIDS